MGGRREPRTTATTSTAKVPKSLAAHVDADGDHKIPVFSLARVHQNPKGEFGWHLVDGAAAAKILEFAVGLGMTDWAGVRAMTTTGKKTRPKHHDQPISSLCKEAQDTLSRFYGDLGGDIFRFRLGSRARLWGFVFAGTFYAVWWDPDHKVCPTEKD